MANGKGQMAIWALTGLAILLIFWLPSWSDPLRERLWTAPSYNASELLAENQALKAEVAALAEVKRIWETADAAGALPAAVLSRYPLNFKDRILVNVGQSSGVSAGQAAVLPERILIGKVEKVFPGSASVQTVFDPGFQAAVRIGVAGVEALFEGGGEPKLALIPKDAEVRSGDIVYTADPNLPYGLPVGEVREIRFSEEELFREATLKFAYDLNGLRAVLLLSPQ